MFNRIVHTIGKEKIRFKQKYIVESFVMRSIKITYNENQISQEKKCRFYEKESFESFLNRAEINSFGFYTD